MGNLWVSLSLGNYNREGYSILYINFYKREVEGVAIDLEDTHGIQGSKKTAVNKHEFWGQHAENGCAHKV